MPPASGVLLVLTQIRTMRCIPSRYNTSRTMYANCPAVAVIRGDIGDKAIKVHGGPLAKH